MTDIAFVLRRRTLSGFNTAIPVLEKAGLKLSAFDHSDKDSNPPYYLVASNDGRLWLGTPADWDRAPSPVRYSYLCDAATHARKLVAELATKPASAPTPATPLRAKRYVFGATRPEAILWEEIASELSHEYPLAYVKRHAQGYDDKVLLHTSLLNKLLHIAPDVYRDLVASLAADWLPNGVGTPVKNPEFGFETFDDWRRFAKAIRTSRWPKGAPIQVEVILRKV